MSMTSLRNAVHEEHKVALDAVATGLRMVQDATNHGPRVRFVYNENYTPAANMLYVYYDFQAPYSDTHFTIKYSTSGFTIRNAHLILNFKHVKEVLAYIKFYLTYYHKFINKVVFGTVSPHNAFMNNTTHSHQIILYNHDNPTQMRKYRIGKRIFRSRFVKP